MIKMSWEIKMTASENEKNQEIERSVTRLLSQYEITIEVMRKNNLKNQKTATKVKQC
jgi:hypothetical protein